MGEQRLIDANELLREIDEASTYTTDDCYKSISQTSVKIIIEESDTVDAVPVVRCKDCNYWYHNHCGYGVSPCCTEETEPEFYCACGERKDGESK